MNTPRNRHAERPKVKADANTVEPTVPYGLEVKGRMRWVSSQLCVASVGERLDVRR
jgi:hypothetical protein